MKPISLHGCELLEFAINYCVNNFFFLFRKLLLHLNQTSPRFKTYSELRRYPFHIGFKTRVISYWSKLVTGQTCIHSSLAYKHLLFILAWQYIYFMNEMCADHTNADDQIEIKL